MGLWWMPELQTVCAGPGTLLFHSKSENAGRRRRSLACVFLIMKWCKLMNSTRLTCWLRKGKTLRHKMECNTGLRWRSVAKTTLNNVWGSSEKRLTRPRFKISLSMRSWRSSWVTLVKLMCALSMSSRMTLWRSITRKQVKTIYLQSMSIFSWLVSPLAGPVYICMKS